MGGRPIRLMLYSDADAVGGAEISAGRLLGELPPRFDVVVAGRNEEVVRRLAAAREGVHVRVIPKGKRRDPGTLLAHVRMLRTLRPDIVQVNMITPWTCRYAIAAGILVRHRGLIAVEHLPHPTSSRAQRRFKRSTSKRLAAHVAVGERSAREVERFAGLSPGSVRTIHNGVPDVPVNPAPRAGQGTVVGTLARLDRQKGLDLLIEALPALPSVTALLVGDGEEREPLLRRAAALGVADRVEITGWRENGRDYLGALDVFVLPSRFEGFPLSILEAMLAGVPVVASDVGSVAEAVLDGETGILVPPEDPGALAEAIRTLVSDAELRAGMGRRARERALLFSPARMARQFEELYEEIL